MLLIDWKMIGVRFIGGYHQKNENTTDVLEQHQDNLSELAL